jgi:hypothetical protein
LARQLAPLGDRRAVIIVSACYSGSLIGDLRSPRRIVITAARADRSSFGCGSESKITYFGDAFLAHALNRNADFIGAFDHARATIAGWERHEHLTPSQPQIDIGAGIAAQLERWRKSFVPGAPLAFKPAASRR